MNDIKINYHEIDFIVPVHRFNIQFSYVTKEGLSFVREFVLRLAHLAPMTPSHIGSYLGLNKSELNEALSDLIDKGDLTFNNLGQVTLTNQSQAYFHGIGKSPKASSLLETGVTLSFELSGFNCIGKKRVTGGWKLGLPLQIEPEILSTTEDTVRNVFQRDFYKILDRDLLSHIQREGAERPSIYTMDSVNKLTSDALRLTNEFYIDGEGKQIERSDFDILDDSSYVHDLITTALSVGQKSTNIPEIAGAMRAFGDSWSHTFFNDNSIDAIAYTGVKAKALADDSHAMPFIGPIYAHQNWTLISEKINTAIDRFNLSKKNDVTDLTWIAPSDKYWGKSNRLSSCLSELESSELTKAKNTQRIFKTNLYLPLADRNDRRTIGRWKSDFGRDSKSLHALVEGFMEGNVEVMVYPNEFVMVCYHIARPEVLPVSMPIGFISTDQKLISKVSSLVNEYLNAAQSFDNRNNLGLLSKL